MFLIRSIGCRVVFSTLLNIVCNGVYYMQPCVENFRKNRSTFHCRGRQSVRRTAYRWIEKFEATVTEVANLTENIKTLSDVKEQNSHQNAVPAGLVRRRHCVVQHSSTQSPGIKRLSA